MEDSQATPEPSGSQRYGGDRPPDITRKVTACVACRKQKIKCHMRDTGPPCTRCRKRGLSCTVNRSLQMILESDSAWKTVIEQKISRLERRLSRASEQTCIPDSLSAEDVAVSVRPQDAPGTVTASPNAGETSHHFEIVMDPNSGPATIPGSVLSAVKNVGGPLRTEQDIISRGVIGVEDAQKFLNIYQDRLDHFLYRILGGRQSLHQIRSSSPFLLSAISAVGALHLNSIKFDELFQDFVTMAKSVSFSRHCSLNDIQALCIGAFWLSSISWMCIGAAVRLCSELQLHRSIFRALLGEHEHYLRTRLYYLVYVCDHHFSIPYGRPPMTREDDAISSSTRFLKLELCTEDDSRLVSQVQFWTVGSDIYQAFGVDVDQPLTSSTIGTLRRLSIELDKVRSDWTETFTVNHYVGNYPKKGVGLHYHFARLYLCSMAFRGIGRPDFKGPDIALDIDEIGSTAILSAMTILRTVVSDKEIQAHLNGLPTYFDIMIAFAVVFLIKVVGGHASTVRVDTAEIIDLVKQLVMTLRQVTVSMHPRHLLVSVAKGTSDLLQRFTQVMTTQHELSASQHFPNPLGHGNTDARNEFATTWPEISFDDFMEEFDFLGDQGASSGAEVGRSYL